MLVKYPRTYHLPWSEGATSDDKMLKDTSIFDGKIVVVSEKMDGENTTLTKHHIHARSLDSKDHPSRHWVKHFWSCIKHEIPDNFRICGENLYAKHSIHYTNLNSFFLVFNIWDGDTCLNWYDTCEYARMLGLCIVPQLYRGPYDEKIIKNIKLSSDMEGYVVRNVYEFKYDDFNSNVAKFVRANHVTTDEHWMNSPLVMNKLQLLPEI